MLSFVAKRLAILVPTLLVLSLVAFAFTHALPGDPAQAILGPNANDASIERMRGVLGLDRPLVIQYLDYVAGLIRLDLGTSAVTQRPISTELATRFPATVELSVVAIVIGSTAGVWLGRFAARRAGSVRDGSATVLTVLGVSVPVFVLGLGLQYLFAVRLGWLPAIGRSFTGLAVPARTGFLLIDTVLAGRPDSFVDALRHLLLPALTLSAAPMAVVARMTRASFLAESERDHVRIASAKGISRRQVESRHIMRNAWPPIVTVIGLQTGALLSGALITENIFGWGGIGSFVVSAIRNRDYVAIQSGLLILAAIFVLVNLAVDLVHARLDPRIRQ